MTRIDEIRDRLDKATPGPWKATYEPDDRWTSITGQGHNDGGRWLLCPEVATCEGEDHPDADLIANAPADLAWCLGKIERLSTKLAMVSLIVDDEPDPCPEHPNDDPVTCGWGRDIISIRLILNDTKEN